MLTLKFSARLACHTFRPRTNSSNLSSCHRQVRVGWSKERPNSTIFRQFPTTHRRWTLTLWGVG
jgi:hypothetical protein